MFLCLSFFFFKEIKTAQRCPRKQSRPDSNRQTHLSRQVAAPPWTQHWAGLQIIRSQDLSWWVSCETLMQTHPGVSYITEEALLHQWVLLCEVLWFCSAPVSVMSVCVDSRQSDSTNRCWVSTQISWFDSIQFQYWFNLISISIYQVQYMPIFVMEKNLWTNTVNYKGNPVIWCITIILKVQM